MAPDGTGFTLFEGGPIHRLMRRLGLAGPQWWRVPLRAALLTFIAWVPPVVLASAQGLATGWRGALFEDVLFHVRFLFCLPVLVLAELVIERRVSRAVAYLVDAELVTKANRAALDAVIARVSRLRDLPVQVALVPLAYALSAKDLRLRIAPEAATWLTLPGSSPQTLSLAGIWDHAVSAPLFAFLLLVALWRFGLWSLFLAQVSRAGLDLAPTHPDKSGGLGFLASAQGCFAPIVLAASASLAASMSSMAHRTQVSPLTFQSEMITFVFLAPLVFWLPLLAFTPAMIRSRSGCLLRFGAKAGDYSHRFEKEWIWSTKPIDLTNLDVSSDNDLGAVFERARAMRTILFDRPAVLSYVVAAGAPMLVVAAEATSVLAIVERVVGGLL